MRAADETRVQVGYAWGEGNFIQADEGIRFVQQSQDDAFAKGCREYGHADVDIFVAHPNCDASILGEAFFGDVQLGHDC